MSDKMNLFAGVEESKEPTNEVAKLEEESNVLPSEVLAKNNNPYDTLTSDQQIIIGDIAVSYKLEEEDVISEFNKAYIDTVLDRWNNDLEKKFKMAKAMMNSVLVEKAKLQKFTVMPIGKNWFYSLKTGNLISTMLGIISYEIEKDGVMSVVTRRKAIKSFDQGSDSKKYLSLSKCVIFNTYEALLIRNKDKDTFNLSEYTSFDLGAPPSGEMEKLSDQKIYETMGSVMKPPELDWNTKVHDSWKIAGLSRKGKDGFIDSADLKAVYVIASKPSKFNAPDDFPECISYSSSAIDFDGNNLPLYFSAFKENIIMFDGIEKDKKMSGVALGLLMENKQGSTYMSVFNFIPFDDGEN